MDFTVIGVKMVVGFLGAVIAIALWSHTREPSWILVIVATLLAYVQILAEFLDALGVFSLDLWIWEGVSILRVSFAALVPLLYAVGLALAVRSIYRVK